ncbi:MAG: hypothetical protein EXS25_04020 [Pedosphaera sp.]|nr:hypothetical protein [Pedosphaera sp.]
MDFLKKHYEKLILGFVLLSVAGVALYLVLTVGQVRSDLDKALEQFAGAKPKELQPANLSTNESSLTKVTHPRAVLLGALDHYTFNPVPWARGANGRLERTKPRPDIGAAGLSYVRAQELLLEIGFAQVAGTPEAPRYQFMIRKDYEKKVSDRRSSVESVAVGGGNKDQLFKLLQVKGPKEDPSEFSCELVSTRESFVLSKLKTLKKIRGYSADIRYEAERKDFSQKRVGDSINLSGVLHKIVAIEKDELVVSAPNYVRSTVLKSAAQ